MFRSFFASLWAKVYSLWAFITRKKRKMVETISLNVLVVPASTKSITRNHTIVFKISPNDSVDQLKPMLKERWSILLKEVEPPGIDIRKTDYESWQNTSDQLDQYKRGEFQDCAKIFPDELISKHFPSQPRNDRIHVVVTIERQQWYIHIFLYCRPCLPATIYFIFSCIAGYVPTSVLIKFDYFAT